MLAANTDWAKQLKINEPSVYRRAMELASADPCEVYIDPNDELGFWRYAVVSAEEPGFWMGSFDTEEEAKALVDQMGWKDLTEKEHPQTEGWKDLTEKEHPRTEGKLASLKRMLMSLGNEFEQENGAAFDLWTWLPSCKAAKKHHGDYYSEFRPTTTDCMKEAALFISNNLNPTQEDIEKAGELYKCPCGESHE